MFRKQCLVTGREVVLGALLAVLGAGCFGGASADRPKVVPVTGAVAYNGKPIAGASVSFWVKGSPRPATGLTDEKGEFQLSTFAINDGCVPGEATIVVVKEDPKASTSGGGSSSAPSDPLALAKMAQEMTNKKSKDKPIIPLRYASMNDSPLKETVKESGENRFVLQLKD